LEASGECCRRAGGREKFGGWQEGGSVDGVDRWQRGFAGSSAAFAAMDGGELLETVKAGGAVDAGFKVGS